MAAGALAAALAFVAARGAAAAGEGRLDAIYKIKDEGFQRSQVMNIMSWLTDVYGPRLTNSPGFRKAGDWAVKEMTSWGLANVKLEPWGPVRPRLDERQVLLRWRRRPAAASR